LVELDAEPLGDYTIPSGDGPGEWDGWYTEFTLPDHVFGSLDELCTLQVTVDPANYYLEYDEDNNTTTAADLDLAWVAFVGRPNDLEAEVELAVWYHTCHGDPVGVRVLPLKEGAQVTDFSVDTAPVAYGDNWPVNVHVEYTGADPLTTDGWRLELIDLDSSEVFYSRDEEDEQEWTP